MDGIGRENRRNTLINVVRYGLGAFFLIMCLGVFFEHGYFAALLFLLAAIIAIPFTATDLENRFNFKMSGSVRFLSLFVLFIVALSAVPPSTNTAVNNSTEPVAAPPSTVNSSEITVAPSNNSTESVAAPPSTVDSGEAIVVPSEPVQFTTPTPAPTPTPENKGKLDVLTNPVGATITVDGVSKGVSPIEGLSMDAGTHSVTVYLSGYDPQQEEVEIANSETKKLFYTLVPETDKSTASTSTPEVTSTHTSQKSDDSTQESDDSSTSKTTTQLSESKRKELIGYVKQYTGSTEITATFIPSNDGVRSGVILVDFYLSDIPNATDLNNNIANIIIISKAVAEESGIQNPDVSVCAAYETGRGLGLGSYDSSTGKTNIDVSDCHS